MTLLQKNYQFPKIRWQRLAIAGLSILIPNVALLAVMLITHTARPLFNLDYLLSILLIAIPVRFIKLLGIILLLIFTSIDTANFVMQLFPFMDLQGLLYLAPFLLSGPTRYVIFAIVVLIYLGVLPYLLLKVIKKTDFFHIAIVCISSAIIGYFCFTSDVLYQKGNGNTVGSEANYLFASQSRLYVVNQKFDLFIKQGLKPTFTNTKYYRATERFTRPYSKKMMLIVNESWGYPKAKGAQEAILQPILSQKRILDSMSYGYQQAGASTVDGEIKELCGKDIKGYELHLSPANEFEKCLPNQLKKQGYATYSYHGASSILYDRYSWYSKAGFEYRFFSENLLPYKRCSAFHGVCDSEILPLIAKSFNTNKPILVYFMTLTSHSPYDESDIYTKSFDCQKYNINDDEVCRNLKLQRQFFEQLAKLNTNPAMKGVEVVVVGDHLPPIMDGRARYNSYQYLSVGWLHYKIK